MRLATLLALVLALALPARAQLPARLVVAEGDTVAVTGGTGVITNINDPFTNATGQVGFTGSITTTSGSTNFVWYDAGVLFLDTDALPTVLSGAETTMGIGDGGTFVYSPSVDGDDGTWTDLGRLVVETDPAPGVPGEFVTFASRPTLTPAGGAFWVSGLSTTQGGATQRRVFYYSPDRTAAATVPLFVEPAPIAGFPTDDIAFDYGTSTDGAHYAIELSLNTGSTANDGVLVLDGTTVIAREGSPTGQGDNWANFDIIRVTNAGVVWSSGDTGGPTATDEYIARDSTILLRQGDTVAGLVLGNDVRGLGIDEAGNVLFAWTIGAVATDEALFYAQASDLAATAQRVLRTGDGLDTDLDGAADYTVADFEFLATDGQSVFDYHGGNFLYVMLELTPVGGGTNRIANVGLDLSAFIPTAGSPGPAPAGVALTAAPNPFHDAAALALTLDAPQAVTVEVTDVLGRRVARLHDGPLGAGRAALRLDGAALAPGVYLVRAAGADWALTRRVTRF